MYDYTDVPRQKIENVDHEIHILGVKLGYFPYLLWGFLIGLFIGGPLFGIGMIVAAVAFVLIGWLTGLDEIAAPLALAVGAFAGLAEHRRMTARPDSPPER